MKHLPFALLLGLIVTIGCAEQAKDTSKPSPKLPDITSAPADDVKKVVDGGNDAAFDLYAKLRGEQGNLFLSPYSISTAFGMTFEGARGDTASQMAKTLHFTLDRAKLQPAYGTLIRQTWSDGKKYQLSVANALWGAEKYEFQKDFLDVTGKYYGASLKEVNFGNKEEAAKTINTWVEQQTNDKIKDLVSPDKLTSDTRLVLTNAIYFKGNWAEQFKKDQTRDEPFFLLGGEKVQAPLMNQNKSFKFYQDKELKVIELPYVDNHLAMIVMLPAKVDGLPDLEAALTRARFDDWRSKMGKRSVHVTLPKFKTESSFELSKKLAEMGMPLAFSDSADFSGLSTESLKLSFVVHKAFVEVNEEGTEAAAATAIGAVPTSAIIDEPPTFRADHPFAFAIVDNRTGSILFLGRILDPRK